MDIREFPVIQDIVESVVIQVNLDTVESVVIQEFRVLADIQEKVVTQASPVLVVILDRVVLADTQEKVVLAAIPGFLVIQDRVDILGFRATLVIQDNPDIQVKVVIQVILDQDIQAILDRAVIVDQVGILVFLDIQVIVE